MDKFSSSLEKTITLDCLGVKHYFIISIRNLLHDGSQIACSESPIPKFDRPVRFNDMESSESLTTEPAMIRDAYLEHFHKWLELIQGCCHEFDTDYHRVSLDQDYEKVLADFLLRRAQS